MAEDLGARASYLALEQGAAVLSSDGERVGAVEHVLHDEDLDVFDGIVIDLRTGPGGWRFADAEQIADVYERGVVLTVDAEAARRLPEPSANPAALESHGTEDAPPPALVDKLLRAWDRISGKH